MTLLPEIDSTGLEFPIWSLDGKYIVATYNIMPMPDFCFRCPEPRSEMILIEPETWNTSTILVQDSFNVQLTALAWSPDSKDVAIYYWDNAHENGVYTLTIENPKPQFLMKHGVLSHDWKKVVLSDSDSSIKIISLETGGEQEVTLPNANSFRIHSWSPNDQQLALIQRKNETDRFENIFLMDLNSGKLTQLTDDESYFKYSAEFSPNGNIIAYIKWRYTADVIEHIVHISRLDKSCEWEIPVANIDYFTWSPDGKKMFLIGTDGAYIADLEEVFGSNFVSVVGCP